MDRNLTVAILGATGAVGQEFLRLFEARNFPVKRLILLASARSAGQTMTFRGAELEVQAVCEEAFEGVDLAFFSAGAERSRQYWPAAQKHDCVVIDNSSAFRMDLDVPLIVPEVNGDSLTSSARLIANPNCTAAILLMALSPLRKIAQFSRIIVSTYQSASGAGAAAMQELRDQTQDFLSGNPIQQKVMPHTYAFNLFSHNTPINEFGYNDEEWKVIAECRKMLDLPDLKINVTCIRVPILRAHSESVTVEFDGPAPSIEDVREVLNTSHGVRVVDDRANNHFPMPLDASGQDDVLVGRLRQDVSNPNAISMFISGDQLLKGAALTAVHLAEFVIATGWVGREVWV
ncbi:MAG: aspartate-semialdehyde dehydrogenase [Armatimonadetes bacterium]|nr:aspartate-semialdehyde dehydrogenase [Armatimonadota bacterium]